MYLNLGSIQDPIWILDENFKIKERNFTARSFEINGRGDIFFDVISLDDTCRSALREFFEKRFDSKGPTFFVKPVRLNLPWIKDGITTLQGFSVSTKDGLRYIVILRTYTVDEYLREIVVANLKDFRVEFVRCVVFDRCFNVLLKEGVDDGLIGLIKAKLLNFMDKLEESGVSTYMEIEDRYYNLRIYPICLDCKFGNLKRLLGYMVIVYDETEKMKILSKLRFDEKIIEDILKLSNFIFILAKNNRIERVNSNVIEITGYSEDELKSMAPWDIISPFDRGKVVVDILAGMEGELESSKTYEVRLKSKEGNVWVSLTIESIKYGDEYYCLLFGYSIEDYKRLEEELRKLSTVDELTGVYNRRAMNEFLDLFLRQCERYGDPLSIMILDLDNFKDVNDRYGHVFGDKVLEEFAKKICSCVRDSDIVARYGGDEFVVVMPKTDLRSARLVAERLLREIMETIFLDLVSISCSIGLTEYRKGDTIESIIKRADEALYEAKVTGKRRISAR